MAYHDDPRRAVDHHRPLAGEAREGGTNRGRGSGADVVGLISERTRQRAALERHLHRVVNRRVPRPALAERDGSIEGRDSDIGEAGRRQDARHPPPVAEREWAGRFGIGRRGRRDDALDRAHRQAHPIVLRLDAPAPQPTSSTRSPIAGAAASIAAWPNTASMASSRAWLATQRSPLWPFQSAT